MPTYDMRSGCNKLPSFFIGVPSDHIHRSTSGVRNAEMKWTNPDRLGVYGVRIVGWPSGIPHQNPSSLAATQNKLLLDSLKNGTLKFIKTNETKQSGSSVNISAVSNDAMDFSWAC